MKTFVPYASYSRRRFLKYTALTTSTLVGASIALSACDTSSTPGKTTLTIMHNTNEVLPAYIKEFEKLNPTVKINFLAFDQTRLNAMFTAGNAPDLVRGLGFDSPFNSARGLAENLDPYLTKSTAIKQQDLLPIQDLWRWDGKQQGKGFYYGLAKDWSMDGAFWCNLSIFQKAGAATPSTTTPMTFDELLTLGKQLTVRQGNKIQTYGINPEWPGVGTIYQMVAQQNGNIFSEDLTKADFTTPEAVKALQWFVDYAQAHIGPSPLDPDPNGWDGPDFVGGRLAMSGFGYWFSGEIATGSSAVQDNAVLIPAPVMGSKRISSCFTATGQWIPASAKQKDSAWKFMEYFMTATPAHDRATSGWGIPALKQFLPLMPQKSAMQKESYQEVQNELPYFATLPNSPYTTSTAVGTILDKYMQQAAKNQLSTADAAAHITNDVNLLLQQGKQTVS